MATSYPSALDAFTNPTPTSVQTSPSHAGQHSNANDAIAAVEGTLGTAPQGSFTTVKDRLDAFGHGVVARVVQVGGSTLAVTAAGTLTSQTTSNANNVLVIQAAIDAAAGAYVSGGYSNGGTVVISNDKYLLNASVVMKYGVSLRGSGYTADRSGTSSTASGSVGGTSLRASTASMIIAQFGVANGGSRRAANPHGCSVSDIVFDGYVPAGGGAVGVQIYDVNDPRITNCSFMGLATGIDVQSTNISPAGTVAAKINLTNFYGCGTAVNVNPTGSGATDGEITNCRFIAGSTMAINMQRGGWQINNNHLTTGSAGYTGHMSIAGLTIITNNYFDTSGNAPHIASSSDSVVATGNYFKTDPTRAGAMVELTSTGYRSVFTSNTALANGTGVTCLVRLPDTTTLASQQAIIHANSISITGATGWVAPVTQGSGTTFTAVTDQDTSSGPYIKGNRTW